MSVTGKRGIGIPVILLHDAEGAVVSIELKNGTVYRGILNDSQDNMNCTLKDCSKRDPDGKESILQSAYIRGSSIKFIILPDILSKAPFFNRIKLWRKFKGHAVFGINTVAAPRGQSSILKQPRGALGGRGNSTVRSFQPPGSGMVMSVGVPSISSFARPVGMPYMPSGQMVRPGMGYPPFQPPPSSGYSQPPSQPYSRG